MVAKRLFLVVAVIVVALAASTSAARADWQPYTTSYTGSSTDMQVVYSGMTIPCQLASLSGTTPPRSPPTATLTGAFSLSHCVFFGAWLPNTCRGTMSLTITGFTAPSASGDVSLDTGFYCDVLWNCVIQTVGPQPRVGSFRFNNSTQVLSLSLRVASTDTGGICSGDTRLGTRRGTATWTVTFAIRPTLLAR